MNETIGHEQDKSQAMKPSRNFGQALISTRQTKKTGDVERPWVHASSVCQPPREC
jgi:hypothetical protein